ncbi:unnamed protein product [Brassicogethes aeneus]|uniref:peptidyl-tRNA hydrolase n=1 Tax=Brassicogethes aeneus TaxID=1431903 RepID=A0A9P0FB97_BRAAE|nr:unnamed protein product [Brassicogethes aeneus]
MGNSVMKTILVTILKTFTNFGSTKMVFIFRTDLKPTRGKLATQTADAAVLLYEKALNSDNEHLKSWLRFGQPKIVLKIGDESSLKNLFEVGMKNNLSLVKVMEENQLVAVGIGPNLTKDIDNVTKGLKLL